MKSLRRFVVPAPLRRLLRVVVLAGVMLVATQAVAAGYEYGHGEQQLLSIKGISWADPTAFVNDWFNERAPQPHILFDVITFVAESIHARPAVYFGYWAASLLVVAWAISLVADVWLPRRVRSLELLVAALLVTGPYFALGTFLVIHREAVPNGLGGALGLLTVAFLIRRRDRAALVAAGLTTAFHVQHGTVVAVALLVAWLLQPDRFRRRYVRWFPVAIVLILVCVYLVGVVRGLVAGSGDVVAICETASPGHCDPQVWSSSVIRSGVLVVILGVAAPMLARPWSWRSVGLVAAPALVALVALATDLANIQPFQTLGREFFLYRFVMAVAPFAPFTIVMLLGRAATRLSSWRTWVSVPVGIVLLVAWHGLTFANITRFRPTSAGVARATAVLAVAVTGGVALATFVFARGAMRRRRLVLALPPAVTAGMALSVGLLLAYGSRATGWVPLTLGYRADDGAVVIGRRVEALTPPGAVIAARPDYTWLRLMSRRAVVVDCKSVPYGGPPWVEYNERLRALGADTPLKCGDAGYSRLSADELLGLEQRFGATYALLEPSDAAYAYASQHWKSPGDLGGPLRLFQLP